MVGVHSDDVADSGGKRWLDVCWSRDQCKTCDSADIAHAPSDAKIPSRASKQLKDTLVAVSFKKGNCQPLGGCHVLTHHIYL